MQPILNRYLDKIIKDNQTIDARGVMQVNRMIELTMDEVFINLSVRMGRKVELSSSRTYTNRLAQLASLEFSATSSDALTTTPYNDIFSDIPSNLETGVSTDTLWNRHNAWVLLGDPGAGKTTLLKHFALQSARECKEGNGSLPILIPLRLFAAEWEQQPSWTVQNAVFNYLADKGLNEIGFEQEYERKELLRIFKQALTDGHALLLFDGLDEQRNTDIQRKSVTAIESLIERYFGNRFLVSSRIIGYDAATLNSRFYTATLEPFDDEQMEAFFRRWIFTVEKHEDIVVDDNTRKRAAEKADQLIEQVYNNPGIRTLATNPLLCTIIGLIRRQGATLPQLRAELYKLCIDTFIFNWELQKRRRDDQQGSLNKDQTQAVLEELALYFHENRPENRASQQIITDIIRDFLVKQEGMSPEIATNKASQLLSLIRDVSGLLIDRGNNEYGFFHLTFQEYLTARAITRRRRDIDRYLGQHLFEPRWREVIRLAAAHQGMKDEETGSEFIEAILRCKHHREAQMHYAFRFAFLCLKEARVEIETSDRMFREWIRLYLYQPELRDLLLKLMRQPGARINYRADALQPLLDALNDNDSTVRSYAAQALSLIEDPAALPALLNALKDKDSDVKRSTIRALCDIDEPAALRALTEVIKDEESDLRWYAIMMLTRIKDPLVLQMLIVALKDKDEVIRRSAALALGQIKDPAAVPALFSVLKDKEKWVRNSAAQALEQINDPAVQHQLIEELKNEDSEVRMGAARALGLFKDSASVPALLTALMDKNEQVRSSAAEALGQIKDPATVPALLTAIKDKNEGVRSSAAEALGQFNDPATVPTLLTALKDENERVRSSAAQALGLIKDPAVLPALLDAIKDESLIVRVSAAHALGQIKNSAAVPALLIALNDKNEWVRKEAAEALGQIKDPAVVPALLSVLKDEDYWVRKEAAEALGQIKDPASVPALLTALKDKDDWVRREAAEALGQIKDPVAVPALLAALRDESPMIRFQSAIALDQFKDPSVLPTLLAAFEDEDIFVRTSVANTIEKFDLGTELCPD